jgi:hypothetical protein
VISSDLAGRLGVSLEPGSPMTGGGGAIASNNGMVSSFRIGASVVKDLKVMSAGFIEMLSRTVGTRLDGIVGHNFLKQFKVTIDYPRSYLRLE